MPYGTLDLSTDRRGREADVFRHVQPCDDSEPPISRW
jgi:hypothetical protein